MSIRETCVFWSAYQSRCRFDLPCKRGREKHNDCEGCARRRDRSEAFWQCPARAEEKEAAA